MRNQIYRAIAAFISACLVLVPVNSSAAGFYKVEIVILNSDGSPSSGQRLSSSFASQMQVTSESGTITFELPAGTHGFTANLFPNSSAVNVGVATSNFELAISGDQRIEIRLPKVSEYVVTLRDSLGQNIAHIPQNLVQLGCSWTDISATGLAKPLRLFFNAPKYVENRSNWNGFSTGGLMAHEGVAKFYVFQFDRPSDCKTEDLGKDGIIDYQIKTASYLDWQIVDSVSLAKGNVVIIAPDAPTFTVKFPIKVIERLDYMQIAKLEGQLSATHPAILAMHGKVSSVRNGNGTFNIDANGNFTLDVYINKFQNAVGSTFNLKTATSYQSQLIPTPPRLAFLWNGQTLSISVSGLHQDMGITTITYGKKIIRVTADEEGAALAILKNVEPAGTATFSNSMFEVKADLRSSWPSCKLLWQDFPGGIALSTKVKNRGKAATYLPTVWPAVYKFNKYLDTDKDNIACER